jgi:hypothetical protein
MSIYSDSQPRVTTFSDTGTSSVGRYAGGRS